MRLLEIVRKSISTESDKLIPDKLPSVVSEHGEFRPNSRLFNFRLSAYVTLSGMAEIFSLQAVNDRQFHNMEYLYNTGVTGVYFGSVLCAQDLCKLVVGLDEQTTKRVISELTELCYINYCSGYKERNADRYQNQRFHPITERMMEIVKDQDHTRESLIFMLREFPLMVKEGVIGPSRYRQEAIKLASG